MAGPYCFLCGRLVGGISHHGTRLQFCCRRCYVAFPEEIKAEDAKSRYRCTDRDIEVLNSRYFSPRRQQGHRRFLRVEAEYLGRLRCGLELWETRQKRTASQERLEKKRTRLESLSGVKISNVRQDLRPFVVGDYLGKQKARILQKTVIDRLRVHDRAASLVDRCAADPMTALDFCVEYPGAGDAEFLDLRERCQRVFRLLGDQILAKVPTTDRAMLTTTPLADVYLDFRFRRVRAQLKSLLTARLGLTEAEMILYEDEATVRNIGEDEDLADWATTLEKRRVRNTPKRRVDSAMDICQRPCKRRRSPSRPKTEWEGAERGIWRKQMPWKVGAHCIVQWP